tara:strand:+ start:473 stop:2143 length:1671 start_codon:yes stop_codon:yes gene_type:complete
MNILEVEDVVKGMPDEALQKEAQQPTGRVPEFLIISEIKRRTDMRERFKAQQRKQPQGSVKEQIISQGIASISPDASKQMPFMQQPAQQPAPRPMPQQMPPQQMPVKQMGPPMPMYEGGVVRMFNGGSTLRRDILRQQGLSDQEIDLILAQQTSDQARRSGMGSLRIPSPEQLPLESAYEAFPGQLEKVSKVLEENVGSAGQESGGFKDLRFSEMFSDDYDAPDAEYGIDQDQDLSITKEISEQVGQVPSPLLVDQQKKTDDQLKQDSEINIGSASVPTVITGIKKFGTEEEPKSGYEVLQDRMQEFMDTTQKTPSAIDLSKPEAMLRGLQVDFSSLAPDYTYEKALAEKRAEEELSQSRKDAWNQALIQLGAGIIEGKTGEGLSKAGQTAYDMIREGKAAARSERDLATKLRMAEQQGAMQTGLQGKTAEIERDKAIASMQADAEKTMYSGGLKEKELALENLVKQAAVLRYGDLVLERDDANMREILDIAGSFVKAAAERYVLEGKSVDDLLEEIVIPIIDQLSPQFRGEIEGEERGDTKKRLKVGSDGRIITE